MFLPRELVTKLEEYETSLGQRSWTTSREWLVIASNEIIYQMFSLLLVKKGRFSRG